MNAPHWRYVLAIVEHALELMAIACMRVAAASICGRATYQPLL
jgi:hypothetical protein